MVQRIVQKNKAATRYLLAITHCSQTDFGIILNSTGSLIETANELQDCLNNTAIPEEEKIAAQELITIYKNLHNRL